MSIILPVTRYFFLLFAITMAMTGAQAAAADCSSCGQCHSSYCNSWQQTTHGQQLLPYSPELAASRLSPQTEHIEIGTFRYLFKTNDQDGWIEEKTDASQTNYKIEFFLGGKNIIAFLTRTQRGRLQVLPLAYRIKTKTWFDNSGMLPHGPQALLPVGSKSNFATFGSECFFCHADSSIAFYSAQSHSYQSIVANKGISCSACHGPTAEHEQIARAAEAGGVPDTYKIFSMKKASAQQVNDTCLSCHSAHIPLKQTYTAGEPFFDNFDLKALESRAFFADGRTLGDSHIAAQWLMNPCAKSGKLQCLHCHTNGGSYRFSEPAQANDACLACHGAKVGQSVAHTRHKANSPGNMCVSCHMPTVSLKGFDRTDHSMRPPMPAATRDFKSPNACTLCHDKKDISWAEAKVASWCAADYQKPYLNAARLISAARLRDWQLLPAMLSYIENPGHDELSAASLIRLLRDCPDASKWPVLINSVKSDQSPLVRSAAAGSLKGSPMGDTASVLFGALSDPTALVRIRAVSMLAALSSQALVPEYRQKFEKAFLELIAMLSARPDDPQGYFNLGNLYLERRDIPRALALYDQLLRLDPANTQALLNSAMARYYAADLPGAEQTIRRALKLQPGNAQAHVTLGMLLAEQKKNPEAEAAFRNAIKNDPANAAAYYNLGVMNIAEKPKNAVAWCRKAYELEPNNPKYGYTYAFYLNRFGKQDPALAVLKKIVDKNMPHPESYALLAEIYLKQNKTREARLVYRKALNNKAIPQDVRTGFMDELQKLE